LTNQSKQIRRLLEQPEWTAEEKKWLLNYLENSDDADLKEIMQEFFSENIKDGNLIDPVISQKFLDGIHQKIHLNQKRKKARLIRMWALRAAAACFAGFLAVNIFLWLKNDSKQPVAQVQSDSKKYKNDVQPGSNKAVLTLADGSTIALDDAKNGLLTQQGNTKIVKQDGKLDYNSSKAGASEVMYNTISTPRGGQYQVELPDGSKAWLNAASSLRFPTAFTGKERRVEITGEVYFEVAKDPAKPFKVSVSSPLGADSYREDGTEIQVLGTHFNVMAYKDESMLETTLLEGSVKFVKGNNTAMLKPGQQLQLTPKGQLKVVNGVDLIKVVAWKNGFFDFDGLNFETIARQLSRWYNVEVVYKSKIDDLFYAEIPRNTKLSVVLKALELTDKIHFEIEGSKIIVLP